MKVKTKVISLISLAAASIFMMAALVGCGGEQPVASGTAPATSAADTQKKDTLVYAGESESTINPILNSHDELPDIIFSGLMKFDGNNKPICDLAESYEYDKDSMTYTFHLRKGVKWHDGKDFTADDVVFTYKVLTEDKTLSASITSNYEDIKKVSAPDQYTVVFQMKAYDAAMLDYFTMGIIPQHLLEGKDINTDSFNQNPVGTGRYKFVSWDTAGGSISLDRNEDYYDKVPNIEHIVYKTVSVESTKATMLQSGEADLAWLNANYASTFRNNDAYTNIDFQTADYRGAAMDYRTEFWQHNKDSVAVLNYALDKDAIVRGVLDGMGEPAWSVIQLSNMGGNEKANVYSYDLDRFAAEMEKLGWKKGSDGIYERNGERFHFTIQVRDYEEERVDIAKLMSQQLEQAGVEMEIVLVTKFDWESGYNGFLAGYATQFDADQAYSQFVTGGSSNNMQYSNQEVDNLLTAARHEKDEAKRKELYAQFEEAYAKEPGVLLVAYMKGCYVGVSNLKGLDTSRLLGHHAVGVMWNVENWSFE